MKGVALNLTHSPENKFSLGACRSFPIWRRPSGECDRDEHRASPPGSKTASIEIVDPPHGLDIAHRPKISLSGGKIGMSENYLAHDFYGHS